MLRAFADGTVFGETYAEGEIKVIWLHGWGRQGADFAPSARILAEHGIASLALDLPGFGSSPAPQVAGGARSYAAVVAKVITEVASQPVVLVGHSFGGRIASVVAAEHPALVKAVLFTGAPLIRRGGGSKASLPYRIIRKARALGVVSEARLEAARQKYGSADYRASSGVMREVLVTSVGESYEAELRQISQPVFCLWGSDDHDVPVQIAKDALELVAGSKELKVLSGIGHLVPTSAPADLAAVTEGLVS